MGDAFRGLTIKIGADTSKLTSALSSIQSSAGQAQKQMNLLSKSLKFDPSNADAMRGRIGLMSDKIRLTARSTQALRTALSQVSEETRKAASKMDGVYSSTQKARMGYNSVNRELEMIYDAVINVVKETKKISLEKAKNQVATLRREMGLAGDKAKQANSEMQKLIRSAAQRTDISKNFGFDSAIGNSSKLIGIWNKLRAAHAKYGAQVKKAEEVEGTLAAQTNLVAYEAELRRAIAETARFKSELYSTAATPALASLSSSLRTVDASIDKARESTSMLTTAFEQMPNSVEASRAKTKALRDEEQLTVEKIDQLKAKIAELEHATGIDRLALRTKNVYKETAKAKDEYQKLSVAVEKARAVADELYRRYMKVGLEGDKSALKTGETLDSLGKKTERVMFTVDKLEAKLREAGDALKQSTMVEELKRADDQVISMKGHLEGLHSRMSTWGAFTTFAKQIRTAGYGMYSTLTPAIMIAGRYAVQSAEEIDSAYRNMRKTVNGTEEEFEELKQAALEFSTTHVTDAKTILEIEAMGGQLGIASENLQGFSEVISSLDIATDIGAEDMAKYMGQLSNIMADMREHKDDPEDYRKTITSFADALVRLGNNSAAQESSIMKVMMRIASLGSISGFTTPELLAIADAVAATGQGCEAAGTAISKTFSNIEAAVAGGGDKLEAFAEVSRMSVDEFADAWNNNPIEAFTAFIEGLKAIDDAGGSVDATLGELGINSVRQKQALEGLTNTVDVMTESLGMANDAWNGMSSTLPSGKIEEAGDAAREAGRKSEGLSGKMQIMTNQAELLGDALSGGAVPFINLLSDAFGNLATSVNSMPDTLKTTIVGIAGFLAAIGPASVGIGGTVAGLDALGGVLAKAKTWATLNTIADSTGALGEAMFFAGVKAEQSGSKIGKFLGKLSNMSVGAAVAGIAAFAAVIKTLYDRYQEAKEKEAEHAKALRGVVDAAASAKTEAEILALGIGELGNGYERVSANAGKYAEQTQKATEKQAQMVDKWAESRTEADTSATLIQHYADIIKKLAGQCDGSAASMQELKTAVSKYNDLTGSSYKVVDDYTGALDVQTEAFEKNTQAAKLNAEIKAYSDMLADATKAMAERKSEYEGYARDLAAVEDEERRLIAAGEDKIQIIGEDGRAYDALSDDMLEVKAREKELRDSMTDTMHMYYADKDAVDKYTETVDVLSDSQKDLSKWAKRNSVDLADFAMAWEDAGRDLGEFNEKAIEVSGSVDNFVGDLNEAGIAPQRFAAMGTEAFDQLLAIAGGDIEKLSNALIVFDGLHLADKEVNITEDGLEVVGEGLVSLDEKGRAVLGEGEDAHVYKVTSEGLVEANEQTEELAEAASEVSDEVYEEEWDHSSVGEAEEETENLANTAQQAERTYTIDMVANVEPAQSQLDHMLETIREISGPHTATVAVESGGNAEGGVYGKIVRAIPQHASGGIFTRATMTNVGIAGEAGDEAFFDLPHHGGTIIPLSNKRHVRPFARAVAAEMGGGQTTVINKYYTIDGVNYLPGTAVAEAVGTIFDYAADMARM